MTLKELLESCNFNDIAPYIKKISATAELSYFKEAFDTLRNMKPATDCSGDVELEIVKCRNTFTKNTYPIIKRWGELDPWEYELNSKIIVYDEFTLTDAEIAAICLWELTYYGDQSTSEGHDKAIYRMLGMEVTDTSNPYAVACEKLIAKLQNNGDNWWEDKRVEKLERKAKVEDTIRRLIADTKFFSREELRFLFNTKLICERTYQSHSKKVDQRIGYLIDLISNYTSNNFSKFAHFLLMFRTSSEYPLTQHEMEIAENFFNQYLPASAIIRYGYGIDEKLDMEVSLLLVCSN